MNRHQPLRIVASLFLGIVVLGACSRQSMPCPDTTGIIISRDPITGKESVASKPAAPPPKNKNGLVKNRY